MKQKRFSEEQIIRILHEVERGELKIADVCRKHGVSEQSFYRWRNKYGGMEVSDARKLKELEGENSRLKRLLAERDIEIDSMKDLLSKKW
jgi:putative transposase